MLDGLIVVLLLILAVLARRHGLPQDGLFHDDAWAALGAAKGNFSDLATVGHANPGFTGILMLWSNLVDASAATMAHPALLAGTLGPAALYLVLRRLGYALSISALISAVLVGGYLHIVYSGHVKSYTLDVLIVVAVAAVLPRLCAVIWNWKIGLTWLVAALLVASISGVALLAAAVAGGVLVLHAAGDRHLRVLVVAVQGTGSLALLATERKHYDAEELERIWETQTSNPLDPFLEVDPNPLRLGGEVWEHVQRLGSVFPGNAEGGTEWWTSACILVALAGIAIGALSSKRRSEAIPARYFALCFLAALAGGFAGKFPFGPTPLGGRYALWMIPMFGFGLVVVLGRLRGMVPGRVRLGADCAICALAAVVAVLPLMREAVPYGLPGSRSAAKFVQSQLDNETAVLVLVGGFYQFAFETDFEVTMRSDGDSAIGYLPDFGSAPVHLVQPGSESQIPAAVAGAQRVLVYFIVPVHDPSQPAKVGLTLAAAGFEYQGGPEFEFAGVQDFRRPLPST